MPHTFRAPKSVLRGGGHILQVTLPCPIQLSSQECHQAAALGGVLEGWGDPATFKGIFRFLNQERKDVVKKNNAVLEGKVALDVRR